MEDDRAIKVTLYVRVSALETWLLNVQDGGLEVQREAGPDGYVPTYTVRSR